MGERLFRERIGDIYILDIVIFWNGGENDGAS